MMSNLIEINSSLLFDEYLQSLGYPQPCWIRNRTSICRSTTAAVRQIQGELRFYLRANALTKQ